MATQQHIKRNVLSSSLPESWRKINFGNLVEKAQTFTSSELLWCYFLLLIPTIFFKYAYLDCLFNEGYSVIVENFIGSPGGFSTLISSILFFGRDFLEVFILAVVLNIISKLFFKTRTYLLIPYFIIFFFLIFVANWESINEIGTLVTRESLYITISWIRDNPEIILKYVHRKRDIVYVLLGFTGVLLWALLPIMIVKFSEKITFCFPVRKYVSVLIVLFISLLWLLNIVTTIIYSVETPVPLRGYWSSTLFSLIGDNETDFLSIKVPDEADIKQQYQNLIFPAGSNPYPLYLVNLPKDKMKKRHIVVVSLETAARKFYPIINNPELPAFNKICRQSIVSNKHYTNAPFTNWAIFSMNSGLYTYPGDQLEKYGHFHTDGVSNVLSENGYETTFIDSYKIDWHIGTDAFSRAYLDLGFQNIIDIANDAELTAMRKAKVSSYVRGVLAEKKSFDRVANAILHAESQNKKALVYYATTIGHYEWKAKPGHEYLTSEQRIFSIIKEFDMMLSKFLGLMKKQGLSDDLLIVFTGDHGLRYRLEFSSLNEKMSPLWRRV